MYEPGPFSSQVWDYFIENTESPFAQIGEDWLDEYLLSHDHITPDSHARADYQKLLGAFRSQPEFHENPDTPLWRIGALVGNENLDFSQSDNYDITSNIIASFQGRLLLIIGELTGEHYPEYPAMQMSYYPQTEHVTIAGVGHTGLWEKPDEVAAAIRSFLTRSTARVR
jgi:pimeloyl-ACP methyl ester carboxylesterase